ncbi:MAG: penicillin acylase family protein, partial [Nocardioidaceae bacterium]
LEAFSAGVNAYLAGRSASDLSLEYAVLGLGGLDYAPEEWTPVDSLAWMKAMAWDLRENMEDEVDRAHASSVLSDSDVADLYPPYPSKRHEPIVEAGAVVDGVFEQEATGERSRRPRRAPYSPELVAALTGLQRTTEQMPDLLGKGDGLGSNAWAVSGDRTSTGRPLLANDPHLAPSMPGVWYQMGLHCTTVDARCPFDVSGYTFAGMPGIVIGHNQRVAWGFSNLAADVTDLYIEKVDGDTYTYDGQQVPLRQHQETFEVADGRDVSITVSSTRHGPLVSEVDEELRRVAGLGARRLGPAESEPETGGQRLGLALRWTALEPGRTADAIFDLNTAQSWEQFRQAARAFEVPAQNLVYADVEGHIGYQTPGRIPIRRAGDGTWPVPGWDPAYDWTDSYVPFDALPSVLDPKKGYVVTANQEVTDGSYPYFLGSSWSYGYRSQRLVQLIREDLSLTVADMAAMQMDSRNGNAATLVPYLLDVNVDERYAQHGQRTLEGWNYGQPEDSAPAAYFNVVWRNLLAKTFHDQLPRTSWPDGGGRWFEVVRHLLEDPNSHWWDDVRTENVTETRDDVLEGAMVEARYEMTRRQARDPRLWTWGHLHQLELVHEPLGTSGIGGVERVFNRGPYKMGGGDSVVDATGWTATRGYAVDTVPSMRMVVSLARLDASRWVNLTGTSGHVYNAHYSDQFDLWRDCETTPWPFSRRSVEDAAVDELTMRPRR